MVNVIAILGFVHQGIMHITGTSSLFSIAIFQGNWQAITQTLSVIGSFFAGSVLAGLIIGDARLRIGRRYGVALAIESGLLFVSTYGFAKRAIIIGISAIFYEIFRRQISEK